MMANKKGRGQKALERAVKGALGTKRDKLRLVPALMGAYVNGQKTLKVAGRPDFVWVRLRGATSEVAQAFNDIVGEHWDLPILIKRDEMAHDRWRVHGRDIRAYSDWGGASYLPPHAESHSFGDPDQTGGIDPVWVFKRQYMPLMPRPQVSGSMSIYLESDFYYFQGEYHWWPGSGTSDMGGYLPTGAYNALFVTVYIDGESGIPQYILGPEFEFSSSSPWSATTDPATYISLPNASQGIPIAAVRLYTGSTTIGWGDIFDLRSPQQPLGTTGSYISIYDEGVYQGAVESIDFIGDNVEAIVSGSYAYIVHTGTAGGHETGTMVIYEEDNWLGVFEEMRFIGDGVTALNSGSYVAIAITGTAIDIPATGSVTVYDETVLLGQADAFNFAGDNVEAVMSGTTAHIMVTGSAGGGGHETGTMVIYDESDWIGVFEEMRFIGDGVDAYSSGSYVAVGIPGYTGSTGTYFRAGECVPLETITGGYWKIPEGEFSTGSLCLAVNGVWQTPVTDFAEQWPTSGTFAFGGDIPTGSVVSAQWGAPHLVGGGGGGSGDGNIDIYDEGVLLGEADALNFVGDNVEAVMSGTTAHIMVTGTAGGGGGHETGTMVIYDEGDFLGVFEEMRFLGAGVDAYNSGSYVAVSIPLSGGTPVSVSTGTFYVEEVLYDVTLGSATGSFVVPGISQEYDHLRILANLRTDLAAVAEVCYIYFNNDTTAANYRFAQHYAGSVHDDGEGDDAYFMAVPSATALADEWSSIQSIINDYADTSKRKSINVEGGERQSATIEYERNMLVWWENTNAINRIDIVADAADFIVGSRLQVIGIKKTVLVTSVDGGGGGHETGTMVIYDEGDFLGVFDEMRFIGPGVSAFNSGSYAAIAITGTAGGGGGALEGSVMFTPWQDADLEWYQGAGKATLQTGTYQRYLHEGYTVTLNAYLTCAVAPGGGAATFYIKNLPKPYVYLNLASARASAQGPARHYDEGAAYRDLEIHPGTDGYEVLFNNVNGYTAYSDIIDVADSIRLQMRYETTEFGGVSITGSSG